MSQPTQVVNLGCSTVIKMVIMTFARICVKNADTIARCNVYSELILSTMHSRGTHAQAISSICEEFTTCLRKLDIIRMQV